MWHLAFLQLEMRLAAKEESLLEKDLLFEQICRITDRVEVSSNAGKDDTISLSKKV